MAITAANLTNAVDASSVSTYTTASISPGASKLDIVSVESFFAGTSTVPTVTGASGTWTQIATVTDSSGNRRVTLFRDLSASPGSGALTIDFAGQVQTTIAWSIDEFSGTDTTGTHGSGALVQSVTHATTSGATTGFTITLAALGSANNAAYGALRNNAGGAVTVGTGFTSLSNQTAGSLVMAAEWAINKTAVAWTWASQTVISVGVAIEIKAFVAAAAQTYIQAPYSLMPDPAW